MVSRTARLFILFSLMLITFSAFAGPSLAAERTYQVDARSQINRTLADLARAERAGDYHVLYDLLVPQARYEIPRQAFVNWWGTVAPAPPVDALKISSINFADETYALTDTDWGNVATSTYSYHDEAGESIERTVKLVEVDGLWRWMPDIGPDDVPEILTHAGYTVDYVSPYSTPTYVELDTFWAQVFADWGKEYRAPQDMIGVRQEGTQTGCGPLVNIEQIFAHYCTRDETIYFNPDMRDAVVDRIGQSAWDMVMAHEWGHHIQNISGMYVTKNPELHGGFYSIEHELQADCLSGIFMQDATVRGYYDSRARREIEQMISMADQSGTRWDDVTAHGSSEERHSRFFVGYDNGFRGCQMRAN